MAKATKTADDAATKATKTADDAAQVAPKTLNKKYEEWRVKPIYEDVKDGLGKKIGNKLTGFEKDAKDPIRVTNIIPERAVLLNTQSENTLVRLYEVE